MNIRKQKITMAQKTSKTFVIPIFFSVFFFYSSLLFLSPVEEIWRKNFNFNFATFTDFPEMFPAFGFAGAFSSSVCAL